MGKKFDRSLELSHAAQQVLPGGVNSPARAFRAVGGKPIIISHGKGSHIWDADGNEYIDYVGSWGPLILGHAPNAVTSIISENSLKGTSFGATTEIEIRLAALIKNIFPSIELIRMVNSGTEACMTAIRLARGYTGREKIIKFEGCYHGHSDSFLVKAGSGALTLGIPNSAGVPDGSACDTLNAIYNDIDSVKRLVREYKETIAAIIVEPIAGNMGCVLPKEGFLEGLREICTNCGAVLIFDEVITGFRAGYGGAQALFKVTPDLTTLGKVIGGGLPVGAFGGKKEIMEKLAPLGPVYQAGTLSGNPLAMAAGYATVKQLTPDFYHNLHSRMEILMNKLEDIISVISGSLTLNYLGSMFCLYFTHSPVTSYAKVQTSDTEKFQRYFHYLIDEGIYIPPSQFEANFFSSAHSNEDIEITAKAFGKALEKVFT